MKERPLLEGILENIEVLVDYYELSDGLIKDIPIVGTAIKICKTAADFRDKLFLAKILCFLNDLNSVSFEAKEKLKEKMVNNPEESQKVGEAIILLLDKISDLEKPAIIAKLFLAYTFDQLTSEEFRRLAEAVCQAFLDDLKSFIDNNPAPYHAQELYFRYLSSTGLTQISSNSAISDLGFFYYESTELGNKFLSAYKYGRELAG